MSLLKKTLILLGVLTAIGAGVYYIPQWTSSKPLSISGVVEIQEVRLGSKIGGRVADVPIREGDVAEPGQLLVLFEAPELEARRIQQLSRVAAAQASLDKARNGWRQEEIQQARSDLETQHADLALAEKDLQRIESLYHEKKLTKADYDLALAARNRMQGRVASMQAHYDMLSAGTRPEDIALAEASLMEAQGVLQEIEANLAEAKVIAPERCLVEVVSVRKGDLVTPNQPVLRVLRANDQWVRAYVPETRMGEIHPGQEVVVTMDSDPERQFRGTIFQISNESEYTPRNIQSIDERRYQVFGLKIRVEDSEGIFKSGMSAKVIFSVPPPADGPMSRLTEKKTY